MKDVAIIGFSGHALVVIEILQLNGYNIIGYVDKQKLDNKNTLIEYLGYENDSETINKLSGTVFFPAIGDNHLRKKVTVLLTSLGIESINAIHPKANISYTANIGLGTLVCQGACINPYVSIRQGVIINTGAIIEHECTIYDFAHIGPGVVLAGNVCVGENTFIGANTTIKQGVKIGNNVIIGAGSVILKDVPDNETWFGNPGKKYVRL